MKASGSDRVRLRFGRVPLLAWREGREIAIRVPRPRLLRRGPDRKGLAAALGAASAQLRDAAWIEAGVPHLCLHLASRLGPAGLTPSRRAALRRIGARLRRAAGFGPSGTNVTFVWDRARPGAPYETRTYERGVEELTRACGSGALAAGRMLIGSGPRRSITLRVASGARLVVERTDAGWVLRGPARRIRRGRLKIPAPGAIRRVGRVRRTAG
jgi:diaminopimelate epimerase